MTAPPDDHSPHRLLPIQRTKSPRPQTRVNQPTRSTWLLDAIPGCAILLGLVVGVCGAIFAPRTTIYVAGGIAFYLALRYIMAAYANVKGLKAIQEADATDWRAVYASYVSSDAPPDALSWDAVKHVVVIPNYDEPERLLTETLTHLAGVELAATHLIVVLAMEAAEAGSRAKGERLQAAFRDRFAGFEVTVHPQGLDGEMRCKSANLAWAGRWLADMPDLDAQHAVITVMDADTVWHPAYFTALTYHFAVDPQRYTRLWQAPIRYHGDIYRIHPAVRAINAYNTGVELAYLSAPWWPSMPISSYSLSWRLLAAADYWDTAVIADEWHMMIKAFFAADGTVQVQPIYLPFTAKATGGDTLWATVKNRYRQSLRHSWGSKEVGYTLGQAMRSPRTPLRRWVPLFIGVAHDVLVAGGGWVFVTVGAQLPLLIHPEIRMEMLNRGLIYPQTLLLEVSLLLSIVLAVTFLTLDVRTRPAYPGLPDTRERLQSMLGILLLPVFAIVFVTIPILHAQMMLLLGRELSFDVTEKQ